MKSLAILRHAKSSWDDHGLADFERPLADRGRRDAPMMATRLAERGLKPDLVITSPAARAEQTAELVTAGLGTIAVETRRDARLYLASPGDLLEVIRSIDEPFANVILVGHNPGLTLLGNLLLPELKLLNLPTCGVIAMRCTIELWSEIDPSTTSLEFYDYPKNSSSSRGATG